MKKALILASVPSMIQQFNMNNIKKLQELGYKVDVAANFKIGGTIDDNKLKDFKKELEDSGINYYSIPFSRNPFSKKNINAYKETKRIINMNKYDIIHLHSPIGGVCGRLAAKYSMLKGTTKVIYTAHGFHFYKGAPIANWLIYYPIEKFLSKYTNCLITINEEDFKIAKKKFKAKDVQLVHGVGVNKEKFDFNILKEEKYKIRESLGLKDDDFIMIYVAEISKRKNQKMLLTVMKKVIKEKENIKLLLVGKDSLNGKLQKKVIKKGLENNVFFLGYRRDIPKLMKISDLLVSTSKQEGLPVNIMEGLMVGLPIIATNCRGNRDLIEDGVTGYIVKNEKMLLDRILEVNLKNNLKKSDISKWTEEEINKKMKELYTNII